MKDIDLTSLNNIDNLLIFKTKIGYVSGNKTEPIKNIFFYNKKCPEKGSFHIDNGEETSLIRKNYQIVFLYKNI